VEVCLVGVNGNKASNKYVGISDAGYQNLEYECCLRIRGFRWRRGNTLAMGVGQNSAIFSVIYGFPVGDLTIRKGEADDGGAQAAPTGQ